MAVAVEKYLDAKEKYTLTEIFNFLIYHTHRSELVYLLRILNFNIMFYFFGHCHIFYRERMLAGPNMFSAYIFLPEFLV